LDIHQLFAKSGGFYGFNEESYQVANTDLPWVYSSGARGLIHAELPLIAKDQKPETYTVRLYFTALENDKPGQRVFDIKLQDKIVMKDFDTVVKAGGVKKAIMQEFHDIAVTDNLLLELVPAQPNPEDANQPVINGIEVLRTNAKEIKTGVATR